MNIKGVYQSTIYRNANNMYTVFSLKLNEGISGYNKTTITCTGKIESNYIGLPLMLTGEIKKENGFVNFNFTNAVPFSASANDIMDFSAFRGLKKETVNDLVSVLGSNIFVWDKEPDLKTKLLSVKGIGPQKANIIIKSVSIYRKQEEILKYITQFGERPNFSDIFLSDDSDEIVLKLKRHPYIYGKKLQLSFKCCDAIARDNGFKANCRERIRAIISEAITSIYESGNACASMERILNGVRWIERHFSAFPTEELSQFLVFAELNNMSSIVKYKNKEGLSEYYLKYSYDNEVSLAENIKRIQSVRSKINIDTDVLIRKCEKHLGIKYNDIQKSCFEFLKTDGIKIITGGPGTGKTTVINGLIFAYQYLFPNKTISLMAPTGRAAQRMAEVTGKEAGTMHRILGFKERVNHELLANFNANFPADLIVIDETSMLDNEIAAKAMAAFKGGATVIFVGDINQLPSVGAGNVLHDIINSGIAETAHLTVNYRQGDLSTIAENAEKIKEGRTDIKTDETFKTVQCADEAEIMNGLKNSFSKLYDPHNPFSTQVLCAVKEGATGVYECNNELQALCNNNKNLLTAGKYKFKKNDKVIIIRNNYDDMCFNGDIGTVNGNEGASLSMKIDNREIIYPRDRINEIHLAYAMSIHKSQGSEYDNVIICLPPETSSMLKRKLIYTAITRAKKKVIIYYTGNALEKAIINNNDSLRQTELCEMLDNSENTVKALQPQIIMAS